MFHGDMAMTSSSPAIFTPPEAAEAEFIDTRFGRIQITREQAVVFPNGLLGMPDAVHFTLAAFPSPKMARFTLLQSLEDASLSFILLPLPLQNTIIAAEDLTQAAQDLEIPADQLATLLVVTVSRESGAAQLSVNARAPVFVHVGKRLAGQYVFPHNKYEIRHALSA